MTKYIAFMDLLGTKSAAISNPGRYREIITCFHNNIINIQKQYMESRLEINVFSDCAYFECDDIFVLCDFLKDLRQKLLFQKVCFNAAVCKGKLQTSLTYEKDGKISIIDFQDEKVVNVYGMQSCFSGAGIYIDPELMRDDNIKNRLKTVTINSIFKSINKSDGKEEIVNCIDLKFDTDSTEFLVYILNLYIHCYILDKRAARYYYTLYATFIEEQDITVFMSGNMRMIKEILKIASQIDVQEDKNIIVVYLINRIYNAQIGTLEDSDDIQDACENIEEALNYIYTEAKMDSLCNLREIDSKLFSNRNKSLFAEFCFNRKINGKKKS